MTVGAGRGRNGGSPRDGWRGRDDGSGEDLAGEDLPGEDLAGGERLQKVLARAGVASRRAVEELIAAGRVRVNGERARLGQRIDPVVDRVTVDGAPVGTAPGLVHYLLNKPAGVVTTASDPQGRRTVVDLVPAEPRVFPVGRLDADSEGLLLLTNDGELAHRVMHPSHGVEKEYLAWVEGAPSAGALRRLREGVDLDDGRTAPAVASQPQPGLVRITIHEGRNRQVRRMLDAVGHPVRRLVRVRIGPLRDERLAPGTWRPLRASELSALRRAVADRPTASRPTTSRPTASRSTASRSTASRSTASRPTASQPGGPRSGGR